MKNIITIDFDIIMAPCINLYNDLIPNKSWDFFNQFEQMKTLTADLNHYQKLTEWLIKILPYLNKEQIIVIEDHGQIIKYLEDNNKVNIYNIDHHHDCGYQKDEEMPDNKLNCGNWGLFLKKKNILNNFIWINNINSDIPPKEKKLVNFSSFQLSEYNLNTIPVPDKLILCLSEPWTPPMFRPLFYTWLDILNNYYNTKFEIDFERCN